MAGLSTNWMKQIGAVVPDTIDPLAHPPGVEHAIRVWVEQVGRVTFPLTKPNRPILRLQPDGHTIVDGSEVALRSGGQQRKAPHDSAIQATPTLPERSQGKWPAINPSDRIWQFCLAVVRGLPLVIGVRDHDATPGAERLPKCG